MKLGQSRALLALIALAFSLCGVSSSFALQVQPVRVVLEAGQRSGTIVATNNFDRPVPIEIVALSRNVARDGSETFGDADSEFSIFPPQALLQPKQSQTIRFQYVGNQRFDTTRAYVIQVREVPVIPEGASGVATVFHFGTAVYLNAAGARADLRLERFSRSGDVLNLTVRNLGRDWGYLSRQTLRIRVGGSTRELTGPDLIADGVNPLTPPLGVRDFALKLPGLPSGEPQVELLAR